jgi:hypothetical protein
LASVTVSLSTTQPKIALQRQPCGETQKGARPVLREQPAQQRAEHESRTERKPHQA